MKLIQRKNSNAKNQSRCTSADHSDAEEMRLAFCSMGEIYLESGEATFKIVNSEGLSLLDTKGFGQILSPNYKRLFEECNYFRYNSSAVCFTINFYSNENQLLGKLISESIFKNIGFGRGVGEWVVNS
jgi:hypothetical protein